MKLILQALVLFSNNLLLEVDESVTTKTELKQYSPESAEISDNLSDLIDFENEATLPDLKINDENLETTKPHQEASKFQNK